ncbi:hypothetical protein GOP47_0015065 [Adiantum capillus-veneris]|uniref:Uncharacterized protein n=1 Tax=Adiantum capillus-veneris TaxID=13818 RepID=A0A9D4UNJ1_ADICA|nr:hypothetical protein GOP47_0015065 [Adiantum capillus-veneris]
MVTGIQESCIDACNDPAPCVREVRTFLVTARAMLAEGDDGKARDNEGKDGEKKQSTQAVAGEDEAVASALEPLVLHLRKHSVKVELTALLVDLVEAALEGGHAQAGCSNVLLHLANALEFVGDD